MTTTIRKATRRDVSLLKRLIRDSFADVAARYGLTPENCPSHPSLIPEANIREGFDKGGRFFIAEVDHEPCGCVGLVPSRSGDWSLVRLAVLPPHRNRGLGGMLVNQVLQEATELGLPRLELGIIAAQTELRRWYEKRGFAAVRTWRPEHLPFDVTIMVCDIPAATGVPAPAAPRPVRGHH